MYLSEWQFEKITCIGQEPLLHTPHFLLLTLDSSPPPLPGNAMNAQLIIIVTMRVSFEIDTSN